MTPNAGRAHASARARHVPWRIALVVVLAFLVPDSAGAHIVSDREVILIRQLPERWIASFVEAPDPQGDAGANRGGWQGVEHQSESLLLLIDACARSDSSTAERAWLAIDAALRRQRPPGDYESPPADSAARLTRGASWIAQFARAEIAVVNSPLVDRFRWRITLMLPKLRRSVDWLVASGEDLLRLHAARPDLLLVDAQAWLQADGIYHEPRFAELGQRALVSALKQQKKDGAFVANANDVAGQARALVALIEIVTYFPMPSLDEAAKSGTKWLAARVTKKRATRAAAYGASDVPMALAYQAIRTKDSGLERLAERVAREVAQAQAARLSSTAAPARGRVTK